MDSSGIHHQVSSKSDENLDYIKLFNDKRLQKDFQAVSPSQNIDEILH